MSKIKSKRILILELSKDFYIEAEETEDESVKPFVGLVYDFWLCRRGYGCKVFMHGLEAKYHKSLPEATRFVDELVDWEYLAPYFEDLLEGDEEVDENLNIKDGRPTITWADK